MVFISNCVIFSEDVDINLPNDSDDINYYGNNIVVFTTKYTIPLKWFIETYEKTMNHKLKLLWTNDNLTRSGKIVYKRHEFKNIEYKDEEHEKNIRKHYS